jgi:DNA-binding phage protein
MALETRPFDPAEYLTTPEGVEEYLRAAFKTDDPAEIADALGVVSRAKGTVLRVAHALGFRLRPVRLPTEPAQ